MLTTDRMVRWVEQEKCEVTFGNVVGAFVGRSYTYRLPSEILAMRFANYVSQRDPKNPNMPIAVGPDVTKRFSAKETKSNKYK